MLEGRDSHRSLIMAKTIPQSTSVDTPGLPSLPPLPPNASVGKRWRFRRNLVIFVAHRHGLSQRLLADVFDLPRSTVSSVIKEFAAYKQS